MWAGCFRCSMLTSLCVLWHPSAAERVSGLIHGRHVQELEDRLTESSWLEATRIVVSNTLCLTHKNMLIFWQSASSARLHVEDWQQHGDGMQRLRIHQLGDSNISSAAITWVYDLSQQSTCGDNGESGGGHLPDHGALAMLLDSGWLCLYNDNGDIAHHQQIFRPDAKQAAHWRPVCTHSSGMLLLTAPNAIYVVQDQDIARILERRASGTSGLPVAACPLPGNFNPPRDLASLLSGGSLTEDFTNKTLSPASDNLFCAGEGPTMAWMQFPTLRRREIKGKTETSESSSMVSSAIQMATQWAAQGIVGIANAVDSVQGTVIPCSAEATWVIVDDRLMQLLVLSPDGLLAACTDDKGRVVLVDTISKTILRSWKGYRDAQVGWVRQPGTSAGRGTGSSQVDSNRENMEHQCKRRLDNLSLVLYAPKREALEIWPPRYGRKLRTFRCSQHCKLFQGAKNTDCMLLDNFGHIQSVKQILARGG